MTVWLNLLILFPPVLCVLASGRLMEESAIFKITLTVYVIKHVCVVKY